MSTELTPLTVTVEDGETGELRTHAGYGVYWWTEGNGGCDCNRRLLFLSGEERTRALSDDYQCATNRYRVVAVEPLPPGYTLADFNGGYSNRMRPASSRGLR